MNEQTFDKYTCIFIAAGMGTRLGDVTDGLPKSFLEIDGKKIIKHHLENLQNLGVRKAIFVVGFKKECFFESIGDIYKDITIEYVEAKEFSTTGHAWSTLLSKNAWEKNKAPVVFVHADVFADPEILRGILEHTQEDVIACDQSFKPRYGDECVVYGTNGVVEGIKFNYSPEKTLAGQFVGVNKWSVSFLDGFYTFLEKYFEKNSKNISYEVVLDAFIDETKTPLYYCTVDEKKWVNINHPEDFEYAKNVVLQSIKDR